MRGNADGRSTERIGSGMKSNTERRMFHVKQSGVSAVRGDVR